MTTIVWIKNDLRLTDSRSVALALSTTPASDIVVVRAKDGSPSHVRPTERRLAIERDHVDAMRPILTAAGIRLIDASRSTTIVPLAASLGATRVISNIETSEDLGFASDLRVARELRSSGIEFVETNADRLQRGTRPGGGPFITGARDLPPLRFDRAPEPVTALKHYLSRLPHANYRRDMWLPGPDATASSRLSIDLACGALSGDRAIHETGLSHGSCDRRHRQAYAQYVARLQWRQSFVQMFETNVAAFPWGPMREERRDDRLMMAAWLAGETGFPLVDAAMRDVTANGWINFRLRQVLSSFALDLLDLDLHLVGVALGETFDDFCPGIHWPQIALQSGMVKGRGPRVINPIKQARELDPTGAYVRTVLPWLKGIPDAFVFEPWRHPSYAGPRPIVDLASASKAARARHPLPNRRT
jgi:deoxyribodipyrimidine photolyase